MAGIGEAILDVAMRQAVLDLFQDLGLFERVVAADDAVDQLFGLGRAVTARKRGRELFLDVLFAAHRAGLDRAFVSAVDMPYLSVDLLDELVAYDNADIDIVLPWDGRDHYLAGIYRTRLAERIDALVAAGERSMHALTDTVLTQRVVLPPSRALTNVNSAADLAQQMSP